MNFFPNYPIIPNPQIPNNDIDYIINKLNEIDNHIKRLEQRIKELENESNNYNHSEPDNSFYMI